MFIKLVTETKTATVKSDLICAAWTNENGNIGLGFDSPAIERVLENISGEIGIDDDFDVAGAALYLTPSHPQYEAIKEMVGL